MTTTYDMLLNPPSTKQPKLEEKKSDPNLRINEQINKEKRKQTSKLGNQQATQLGNKPPGIEEQRSREGNKQAVNPDAMTDVMTSQFQAINLKQWQEIIEDTETQNSALRLTSEERYAIEDVVNELRRKHGIKTSMNEIARLGLLVLIHDFKQNKKESMIHKVKKA